MATNSSFPKKATNQNDGAISCNAEMRPAEVREYYALDDASRSLMCTAMSGQAKLAIAKLAMQLSARAYYRILKLARTIADLAGAERIGPAHLAEALQHRPRLQMV